MSTERTLLALAAVLVGGAILSRKASAAPGDGGDVLEEIKVTARRIEEGGVLDTLFKSITNTALPLGIRNNNPMNIRETDINWQGELPHDGDGYEDFETPLAGIRAGSIVLLNYWRIHRLNTVSGIISRWAPPADNNPTQKYIKFAAERLGVAPTEPLNMDDFDTVLALVNAIIHFENGHNPYTQALIRDGVKRAFA